MTLHPYAPPKKGFLKYFKNRSSQLYKESLTGQWTESYAASGTGVQWNKHRSARTSQCFKADFPGEKCKEACYNPTKCLFTGFSKPPNSVSCYISQYWSTMLTHSLCPIFPKTPEVSPAHPGPSRANTGHPDSTELTRVHLRGFLTDLEWLASVPFLALALHLHTLWKSMETLERR